jgi:hypothetical protein
LVVEKRDVIAAYNPKYSGHAVSRFSQPKGRSRFSALFK